MVDAVQSAQDEVLVRRMGLTHREFLRSLPAAAAGMQYRVQGDTHILLRQSERSIEIRLGPERSHSLGSLVLPQTEVRLHFDGFTPAERELFLRRFDLAFQRGGG